MNCDGVRDLLSAYLDGELSPGELLRVEQHLRRCHACAEEVDSLRQTVALVASLEEVELPASFHAQLHERLVALGPPVAAVRRAPVAPYRQRNARRWAMPAAAAAAAFAIGLTTYSMTSQPDGLSVDKSVIIDRLTEKQPGPVAVNPPSTGPTSPVSNTNGSQVPTGSQTPVNGQGKTPPLGTSTNVADNGSQAPSNLIGDTGRIGGAGTATPNSPVTTPAPVPVLKQYAATFAVVKDEAKVAALKSQYALTAETGTNLVLTVPAKEFNATLAQVSELFPGTAPTYQTIDLGASLAADQTTLAMLKAEQDQLLKVTRPDAADQARLQSLKEQIAQVQDGIDLLLKQADVATVTLTYQPAAR